MCIWQWWMWHSKRGSEFCVYTRIFLSVPWSLRGLFLSSRYWRKIHGLAMFRSVDTSGYRRRSISCTWGVGRKLVYHLWNLHFSFVLWPQPRKATFLVRHVWDLDIVSANLSSQKHFHMKLMTNMNLKWNELNKGLYLQNWWAVESWRGATHFMTIFSWAPQSSIETKLSSRPKPDPLLFQKQDFL